MEATDFSAKIEHPVHVYILLKNQLRHPEVSALIEKIQKDNVTVLGITAITPWLGSRRIGRHKVKSLSKNSNLWRFISRAISPSVHPQIKDPDITESFHINTNKLPKLNSRSSGKKLIIADDSHGKSALVELLHDLSQINEYYELLIGSGNLAKSSLGEKDSYQINLTQLYKKKSALIIQPDWEFCGSAKTFDLVARLFVKNNYKTISLRASLRDSSRDVEFGAIYRNSRTESWLGSSVSLGLGSNLNRFFIGINYLFRFLFSRKRDSVVIFIRNVYRGIKLPSHLSYFLRTQSPDIIYVNHFFNIDIALKIQRLIFKKTKRIIPIILDTHDIQCLNYQEQGYMAPLSIRQHPLALEMSYEFDSYKSADVLIFVSDEEKNRYTGYKESRNNGKLYVGIPVETGNLDELSLKADFNKEPPGSTMLGIIMADNQANRKSLEWFARKILPLIEQENFKLRVYGGIHKYARNEIKHEKLEYMGIVSSLEQIYEEFDIAILPVVTGNGIAIKSIEAIMNLKPVVGTTLAARGLPGNHMGIFHDHESEFARDLIALIRNPHERIMRVESIKQIAIQINKMSYEQQFASWISDLT